MRALVILTTIRFERTDADTTIPWSAMLDTADFRGHRMVEYDFPSSLIAFMIHTDYLQSH